MFALTQAEARERGCRAGAQSPPTDAMLERLRSGYDAFNARDLDAFLALMSPNVEFHSRVMSDVYLGHPGIRRYFREWIVEPWERLHLEAEQIEAYSPRVGLVRLHLRGRSRDTRLDVDMRYWEVLVTDGEGLLLRRTVFMHEDEARAEAATTTTP